MAENDPQTPPSQTPPPADKPPEQGQKPQEPAPVPYTRFKEVNDQLAELKTKITALTGEKQQKEQAQQTLEQRLAELENNLTTERAEKQRLKVASEKKLPPELADRLRGATEEELQADADRLLAFLKPADAPPGPGVPPPAGGGRRPTIDLSKMTPAEVRKARAEGKI